MEIRPRLAGDQRAAPARHRVARRARRHAARSASTRPVASAASRTHGSRRFRRHPDDAWHLHAHRRQSGARPGNLQDLHLRRRAGAGQLPGFSTSVDYWKVDIGGAIGTLGLQRIVNDCFNSNKTASVCNLITFDSSGFVCAGAQHHPEHRRRGRPGHRH